MKVCYSIHSMTDHDLVIEGHKRTILAINAPYCAIDMDNSILVVKIVNCKDALQGARMLEIPK